jgi:hypothetical protein
MQINTTLEFKTALRSGPYAWPGGYPLFFICDDGGYLCCGCARKEARTIMEAIHNARNGWQRHDDWRVVGMDINWEDPHAHCEHCGDRIESAYAD